MSRAPSSSASPSGLTRQPIRVIAFHNKERLMEMVFQHSPIRIGRLLDNDIVLPFDFVSRFHCELRFIDGQWTAVDLGSKNGIASKDHARATQLQISDGSQFQIEEVSIQVMIDENVEIGDFTAIRENATVIGEPEPAGRRVVRQESRFGASSRSVSARSISARQVSEADPAAIDQADGQLSPDAIKRPLLDIDLNKLMMGPHERAESSRDRALQMNVVWHDQILESREIPLGVSLHLDLTSFGAGSYQLGTVSRDKTKLKLPKGAALVGDHTPSRGQTVMLTVDQPVAFRMAGVLLITIRYVPKSLELAESTEWVEQKLLDPLLASSAIHGAAAVTILFLGPKKHAPPVRDEPERFASIIVQPTPTLIAMADPTPTPTPTPAATEAPQPTPTATPLIAKKEQPVATPRPDQLKKVVTMEKKRRPALKRREDPGMPQKETPKEAKVLPTPPDQPNEKPPVIAQVDEPPAPAPTAEPAPTPQPFNAKSVGTLKMLSALSIGPATNVANVEKIEISRAPASEPGSMTGREAVAGTGDMISKLAQSATGGGTGRGTGAAGVALGGKSAGARYEVAGLSGNAGKRKIRGSVLGGATYTELSKNEGLTREQVMKVVQKHQAEIQTCYERSLMQNPDLVGRAEFEWEITPQGDVTFVNVKETTLRSGENLLACVKGVFAKMKFPQAKNGESTNPSIGLPFGRL